MAKQSNTGAAKAAGVNIGFGFTKAVADGGRHLKLASFVREVDKGFGAGRRPVVPRKVHWESREYEVGEGAAMYGTGRVLRSLHREWADSQPYRVLAQTVIDWLAQEGSDWVLTVGLAIDHFRDQDYRRRVEQLWSGTWPSASGQVNVLRAHVVPEPAGAMAALSADPAFRERLAGDTLVIVDIGRLTTNWLFVQRGVPIPSRSGSVDIGMTAVLTRAQNQLARQTMRPQLSDTDVELAYLGVAPILTKDANPQPVAVDQVIRAAANEVWPGIEQAIKPADLRGIDVLAVGGGAKLFAQHMKDSLRTSTVFVPSTDPQMLNAIGLHQIAAADASKSRRAKPHAVEQSSPETHPA
jgi:hypothetical protein